VPGIAGTADEGEFFFEKFKNRRCIAISMRGRGKSSTPTRDYAIADHGTDLLHVLKSLGIESKKFHLHGYSIGAMYVLSFLLAEELIPASVIIGDHGGGVDRLPLGWAKHFASLKINDKSVLENIRPEALNAIEADSTLLSLYEPIKELKLQVPLLLLAGGQLAPFPSRLTAVDIERYRECFSELTISRFEDAGHFFRDTDRQKYLEVMESFIKRFDD
jgi:pimeloyl-ACP methyl ester carboxylesterase